MGAVGVDSEKGSGVVSLNERAGDSGDSLDLTVQGRKLRYSGAADVRSLLESEGENALYANVRINGEILSRRDFENIPLHDGDSIDFLYFMGGGLV